MLKTRSISADVDLPFMKCWQSILMILANNSASLNLLVGSLFIMFMKKSFNSTDMPRLLFFFAERMIHLKGSHRRRVVGGMKICAKIAQSLSFCMAFETQSSCLFKLFTFCI